MFRLTSGTYYGYCASMKRDIQIKVMVSKAERKDFDGLATARRKTISEIIRELLNREVELLKQGKAA